MAGSNFSSGDTVKSVGKLTPQWLAAAADSILVGRVTDISFRQPGVGNIYTLVTLSVEQHIKGDAEGEVVIKMPGGKAGGLTMMVTDYPSFKKGERAVVFLAKREGIFTVAGGLYGKLVIDENNTVGDKSLTELIKQIKDILAKQ
jgi:hypothetical protein